MCGALSGTHASRVMHDLCMGNCVVLSSAARTSTTDPMQERMERCDTFQVYQAKVTEV